MTETNNSPTESNNGFVFPYDPTTVGRVIPKKFAEPKYNKEGEFTIGNTMCQWITSDTTAEIRP